MKMCAHVSQVSLHTKYMYVIKSVDFQDLRPCLTVGQCKISTEQAIPILRMRVRSKGTRRLIKKGQLRAKFANKIISPRKQTEQEGIGKKQRAIEPKH